MILKNPANIFFSGNGNCAVFPLGFELLQNFKENIKADNHSLRVSADALFSKARFLALQAKTLSSYSRSCGTTRSFDNAILKNCFSLND